jgi:thioesterase domain-containing protein
MRRKFYTIVRERAKAIAIVDEETPIVALQPAGEKPAFFMVDSFPYFIDVVQQLETDRPVLSLISQEKTQTSNLYSIYDEAAAHVKAILAHQPCGPYLLGGCSASAIVAYEIAQQLRVHGHQVALLVIFDSPNPNFACDDPMRMHWRELPGWVTGKFGRLIARKTTRIRRSWSATNHGTFVPDQLAPLATRIAAALNYRPKPYLGRFLLFKRDCNFTERGRFLDSQFGWGEVVKGEIEVCELSADNHLEIFKAEHDRTLVACKLQSCFEQVAEGFVDMYQSSTCMQSASVVA